MSVFRLQIDITGQEVSRQKLFKLENRVKDFTPVFKEIESGFEVFSEKVFASGGAVIRAFAPLTERYRIWKEKHYPGQPILTASGRLRASLTGTSPDTITKIEPLVLTRGTSVPYSGYLQAGTSRMVKRPPIRLNKEFWDWCVMKLDTYIRSF